MKIDKIIYQINEEDNTFSNCIVIYEDGTKETSSDVIGKIMDFMSQEGLSLDKAMKDPRILRVENKKDNSKTKPTIKDNSKKSEDKEKSTSKEEKDATKIENGSNKTDGYSRSKKARKIFIRITALATATVLGVALVDYILNRNKSRTINNNNNKTKIEQNVNSGGVFELSTNTPAMVTQKPVAVSKTDTKKDDSYNETFRENVDDTINHVDNLTRNVMRLNNGERLSGDELLETLNGINRLCQVNMAEVEKLIEGGNMSGDMILPLFDEMFPSGSIENEVISNFTSRRNIIVEDAYLQDGNLTTDEVNKYNDFFLDYIFGDVTFEHGGKRYGYYDISPIARYIVFMLGQTTLETNHDYFKNINGNDCDFNTIISELEENYNLVTSQLFNSGKTK